VKRPEWMEQMEPVGGGVFGWIGIVVGLLIGALVVVAVVAGYVSSISDALHNRGPYRGALCLYRCDRPVFRVQNDTGAAIVLRACDHHCGAGDGLDTPKVVARRHAALIRTYGFAGVHDWYAVSRESGARLGCLVLDEGVSYHGVWEIAASAAGSCAPDTPSTVARHARA
jgi:hypothetical protein